MYFLEVVDWLLMEIATKTSLDQKNMTMTRQKKIATYTYFNRGQHQPPFFNKK